MRARLSRKIAWMGTIGVLLVCLGAWAGVTAASARSGAAAAAGLARSGRMTFRPSSNFLITLERNDGQGFTNITSASCKFKQANVAAPVNWTFGSARIHTQSNKRVSVVFVAVKAAPTMTPTTGTISVTVTDQNTGQVSTGNINVDEADLDPCPPVPVPPQAQAR
jgi:hypothetical protein